MGVRGQSSREGGARKHLGYTYDAEADEKRGLGVDAWISGLFGSQPCYHCNRDGEGERRAW